MYTNFLGASGIATGYPLDTVKVVKKKERKIIWDEYSTVVQSLVCDPQVIWINGSLGSIDQKIVMSKKTYDP